MRVNISKLVASGAAVLAAWSLSGCAVLDTWDSSPKSEMTRSQKVEFCNAIENRNDPICSGSYQAPVPSP